eukprot:gnl/TRDRNA2_/TRDRNA2_87510_c0_seq2.p1 gnl/TRDRNA2_/TRDRNA2_87510_c0~~gnl/TRDRNA2_/TRDRNA2_87510_c0_seq2.p1  ORF type:complete len:116 (+),score=6.05 gnl/TRDRNA2_/TRDRNA2_87510_c0_seq2:61-408(+)
MIESMCSDNVSLPCSMRWIATAQSQQDPDVQHARNQSPLQGWPHIAPHIMQNSLNVAALVLLDLLGKCFWCGSGETMVTQEFMTSSQEFDRGCSFQAFCAVDLLCDFQSETLNCS